MLGAEHILLLTNLLGKIPEVQKYNVGEHQEESALALALNDIAESCERIVGLERSLVEKTNPADVYDVLHSIREELRHITYHIDDSHFLNPS